MKTVIRMLPAAALAAALLLTQAACMESEQEPVAENPALASPVPAGAVRGTVLETMNSGGYTYVLIDTGRDRRWVAGREIPVEIGDVIQASEGMAMNQFESKSLNRTFDVVYFSDAVENLSTPAPAESQTDSALPTGHPSIDGTATTSSLGTEAPPLDPGKNIAYIYANKDALADQQISLRGKVVKYNGGILGNNFFHIQDGSGDAADGSNG